MTYAYTQHYPIDGWFVDGCHDYTHPNHEAKEAIKSGAGIIIFHDADISEVYQAVSDAFGNNPEYKLFRIIGTRIAHALKK